MSGTLKFGSEGSAFSTNGSYVLPRNPAFWPCGMLPPVLPIGSRQQHVRRDIALRTLQLAQARSRCADTRCRPETGGRSASSDGRYREPRRRCDSTLRMMAYLSACFAMRGKFSEISMPGTLVLMGLYGPRISDRRVRLHVPGVELRRPADQEQHDAVDVLVRSTAPWAFMPKKSVSPRPSIGERAGVQEIAPPQAVAELDGAVGIQAKHPALLLMEVWLPF